MRATIDLDLKNLKNLQNCVKSGLYLTGRYPEIRASGRGWHIVWSGVSEELSLFLRYLWDDECRMRLDLDPSHERYRQVLFSRKKFVNKKTGFVKETKSVRWS